MRLPSSDVLFPVGLSALVLALLFITGIAAKQEAEQWELYKKAHNCREAGYIDGDTAMVTTIDPGTGNVGLGTVTTPRKTRWLCDNDVEIFR